MAYARPVILEWDSRKALANLAKHGVDFREAGSVMGDRLSVTFADHRYLTDERRFTTIGASASGRILVVVHTDRGEAVRLISARRATPRERRFYEEGQ